MSSLMTSTSTDPAGIPVSTSELCSSSIFSTNPRFSSGDVQERDETKRGYPQKTVEAYTSTERMARKRKTTANTWAHAREPLNSEPSRCGRKNEKIYYCMHCVSPTYSTTVSTTFRNHLLKIHGIELEAHEHPIKKRRDRLIQDAFAKAGDMHAAKQLAKREET
ncbi:Uncharacterized protein HZ326_30653, partial [Fusarium oxysporum f. sp. albedinis]